MSDQRTRQVRQGTVTSRCSGVVRVEARHARLNSRESLYSPNCNPSATSPPSRPGLVVLQQAGADAELVQLSARCGLLGEPAGVGVGQRLPAQAVGER